MSHDQKYEQNSERRSRYREEVDRHDIAYVVAQESPPRPRRRLTMADRRSRYCWSNINHSDPSPSESITQSLDLASEPIVCEQRGEVRKIYVAIAVEVAVLVAGAVRDAVIRQKLGEIGKVHVTVTVQVAGYGGV